MTGKRSSAEDLEEGVVEGDTVAMSFLANHHILAYADQNQTKKQKLVRPYLCGR